VTLLCVLAVQPPLPLASSELSSTNSQSQNSAPSLQHL